MPMDATTPPANVNATLLEDARQLLNHRLRVSRLVLEEYVKKGYQGLAVSCTGCRGLAGARTGWRCLLHGIPSLGEDVSRLGSLRIRTRQMS
jgi:hypothetical protein